MLRCRRRRVVAERVAGSVLAAALCVAAAPGATDDVIVGRAGATDTAVAAARVSSVPTADIVAAPAAASVAMPDEARQRALSRLLAHDCGSCHGLTLRGGLGSPLTAEALARRPDAYLETVIRDGVPGTAMPPWGALLDAPDIRWLVGALREPERLR